MKSAEMRARRDVLMAYGGEQSRGAATNCGKAAEPGLIPLSVLFICFLVYGRPLRKRPA
jgi:hypothetical protein